MIWPRPLRPVGQRHRVIVCMSSTDRFVVYMSYRKACRVFGKAVRRSAFVPVWCADGKLRYLNSSQLVCIAEPPFFEAAA